MSDTTKRCERCQNAFGSAAEHYACEHNCTFCKTCTAQILQYRCPNCQGELKRQPNVTC